MGRELPQSAPRSFNIRVDGTAKLASVELLRDGCPVETWTPGGGVFEQEAEDEHGSADTPSFYLVRVKQDDGHIGWTSPIWFG